MKVKWLERVGNIEWFNENSLIFHPWSIPPVRWQPSQYWGKICSFYQQNWMIIVFNLRGGVNIWEKRCMLSTKCNFLKIQTIPFRPFLIYFLFEKDNCGG
jgi:hypothetical protein